jgi:DNA-binding CsgD family transcriptional regulator/PAS domain-containing protein
MTDAHHEQLLDLISDATLDPALWTTVLEQLTSDVGGRGAMLSRLNVRDGSGAAEFVRPDAEEARRAFDYYASKNPLMLVEDPTAYLRNWTPRVLTDDDLLPKEEFVRSEFYNDFMRPLDMHSVMLIRLAIHEEDIFAISISRAEPRGRFRPEELAAIRRLHPHLLRSFTLGRRFAATRDEAHSLSEAMNALHHPVIMVGEGGMIRHVNAAAEALMARRNDLAVRNGRLSAANAGEARRLHQLIGLALSADPSLRDSGSMSVGTSELRLPLSVIVSPLRSARDSVLGCGASVMVAITDPEAGIDANPSKLQDLFGLSPAEIRVALAIFNGQTPKEAAASLGVSFFTIRGHLARVFEKTNTNRQAQLVRMMMQALRVS